MNHLSAHPFMGGGRCGCVKACPIHACMCMHTHACVYDIIEIPQGFPYGGSHLHEFIMFIMHVCVCVCMCMHSCMYMHAWDTPLPHIHPYPPTHIHPPHPPPMGGALKSVKNLIKLEQIKIF